MNRLRPRRPKTPAGTRLQESLFLGRFVIVLLIVVSVLCCTLLIRWILKGPPPPPPRWGTRIDDE
jgi:hypothetical protein